MCFLNRMGRSIPFEQHEVREYERRRYKGLDQRFVDWKERRLLRKILQDIKGPHLRALDIPCGYGRFSRLLHERGFSIINSDLSFHMVNRVKEKSNFSDGFLGVVADAKKGLPFRPNTFELLLSMRFFHHVHKKKDREYILREFFRVSSAGVILSYYRTNFIHLLQRKLRRKMKKSRTRINMIPHREFKREIESEGFHLVKIYSIFRGLHSQHIAFLKK